ncbi:MAG TPA: GNAT family N-acetyltransferase [Rhodanobacteraceae bacterium]|nr:GNAT family N-acetyltransferase [Rhodanobacteraceae bacterium]
MSRLRSPLRPPERLRYGAANEAPPAEGERIVLADGRELVLRPIHAGDVAALQRGFAHLSTEEVRLRFLHVMKELPNELAERLCRLDPEREIAFVLADPPGTPDAEIHAVSRAFIDPVTEGAEYALIVQKAYTGLGLGYHLMQRLIAACRARGVRELWGDVLAENHAMLQMCGALGFERHAALHDPGVVRVTLRL